MLIVKKKLCLFCDFVDVENADVERDKYIAPLLLPTIEKSISRQKIYRKELEKELLLYKKEIDYDTLCLEMPSAKVCKK